VPHWFQREAVATFELSASEQLAFYAVCGQSNNEGVAKASHRLIEERTGMARSTVKTAMTKLLRKGILELHWPAGTKTSSQYRIPETMPVAPSKIPMPTRTDTAQARARRSA